MGQIDSVEECGEVEASQQNDQTNDDQVDEQDWTRFRNEIQPKHDEQPFKKLVSTQIDCALQRRFGLVGLIGRLGLVNI